MRISTCSDRDMAKLEEIRRTQVQKRKPPYNGDDTVLKAMNFILAGKLGEISPRYGSFE